MAGNHDVSNTSTGNMSYINTFGSMEKIVNINGYQLLFAGMPVRH